MFMRRDLVILYFSTFIHPTVTNGYHNIQKQDV